jgi:hypothetical protein
MYGAQPQVSFPNAAQHHPFTFPPLHPPTYAALPPTSQPNEILPTPPSFPVNIRPMLSPITPPVSPPVSPPIFQTDELPNLEQTFTAPSFNSISEYKCYIEDMHGIIAAALHRNPNLAVWLQDMLLHNKSKHIKWVNKRKRIFQITNIEEVGKLWGMCKKHKKGFTKSDSLSRIVYFYTAYGMIRTVPRSKVHHHHTQPVYQFIHPL